MKYFLNNEHVQDKAWKGKDITTINTQEWKGKVKGWQSKHIQITLAMSTDILAP